MAETGKISLHDVGFLTEAVGNINKVCPVSAQAKNLFVQLANMAPPDDDEEEGSGDIEEFKDVLESALDVLDDDFSMLDALEEEEGVAAEELPSVMLAGTHAGSGAPATAAAGLAQLEHSDSATAIPVNQNAASAGINVPLAGQGAAKQAGGTETIATPATEIPSSEITVAETALSRTTATTAAESASSEATGVAATETAPSEMTKIGRAHV